MTAERFTPEGIWGRVDAARVAVEAAATERDAEALRLSLALVLADAEVDGEDVAAAIAEYGRARDAHLHAKTTARQARDDLHASRGIDVWSVA